MPPLVRAFIAALVAGAACAAAAQPRERLDDLAEQVRSRPFELTADAIEVDLDRELYVARGNVRIVQEERTLRADWAAFNRRTGAGVASGDVELVERGEVLRAQFVEFDIDDFRGVIHQGSFESESTPFRARGAEIAKTGENTYTFKDGAFTTCRCPDADDTDPWTIRASEADLEVEGYGTVRNATFDVLGVPVAWIPWIVLPLKSERQSGLLFPELSLSSFSGFEVGLPFFWALHEQAGLVLTPRYSVQRGFGGAASFDYVLGEESEGETTAAYTRDQDIDADTRADPYGRDRWSLHGAHDLHAPGGLRLLTDYRLASDNDVPFDFDELGEHRSDRFLESEASVTRGFGDLGRLGLGVGATFADDLQNPDDLDRDRFLIQRWPTASATLLPGGIPGVSALVPALDVEYAWFQARERAADVYPAAPTGPRGLFLDTGIDGVPNAQERVNAFRIEQETGFDFATLPPAVFDPADPHGDAAALVPGGSEGDGVFQEGEPLADSGHRLLLHPRLAVPLAWRGISVVPEVGWHQSLYETRLRDFEQRGFLTTRVEASTRFTGRLGGWLHLLEPQVGYALATAGSQSDNPLFVPDTAAPLDRVRALDLDAVTRDPADRIARASQLTFGFGNRLFGAGGDDPEPRLRVDATLLGLYDFHADRLAALILDGRAWPAERTELRFHADLDPDRGRFDEVLGEASWAHPAGVELSASYRYAREIPLFFEDFLVGDRFDDREDLDHIHQVNAAVGLALTEQWSLRYRAFYAIEQDLLLANQGLVEYLSRCGCWAVGLQLSQDRNRGFDVRLQYRLVGLGGEPDRRGPGLLDGLGGLW